MSFFPFPVFNCREMHPSQSIWEKCPFSVSFLSSTLVMFLFSVVVCLLISVLSFCISVSGFFSFFHIPNACLKILNCIWTIVLPFSSALWLFKRRGRESSAEMLSLAFSDFHSSFSVSVTCSFCDLFIPYLESSIAPSSVHFYGWCREEGRVLFVFRFCGILHFLLLPFLLFTSVFPRVRLLLSLFLWFAHRSCASPRPPLVSNPTDPWASFLAGVLKYKCWRVCSLWAFIFDPFWAGFFFLLCLRPPCSSTLFSVS